MDDGVPHGGKASLVVYPHEHAEVISPGLLAPTRAALGLVLDVMREDPFTVAFQTYGPGGTGSVRHLHWQLWQLPQLSPVMHTETAAFTSGSCVLCDTISYEVSVGSRTLADGPVLVWVPWWSADEIVLAPKAHGEIETDAFAAALVDLLAALAAAGISSAQWWIHRSPNPQFHPHMHLRPSPNVTHAQPSASGMKAVTVRPAVRAALYRGDLSRLG